MKSILRNIEDRKFKEAFDSITDNSFEDILKVAYDSGDSVYYDFINFLIEQEPLNWKFEYYGSEIMIIAYNYLPDGYKNGLMHARNAIRLNPHDIELKEHILLYNHIPEKLLNDEEAKQIAAAILEIKTDSKAALLTIMNK